MMILVMTAVVFTGCGAGGSAHGGKGAIAGSWKCSSLDMGSGNVLDQLGSTYSDTILFYAMDDGSCLLDMAGQQLPMEWKWMDKNNDYKLTITLAGFAEANGMTEDEMKAQLQGSSGDIETEQSYRAVMEDGKIIVNMASFYDESQKNKDSSAASENAKMEFTFERTGDAPKSMDDVKVPAAALQKNSESSAE